MPADVSLAPGANAPLTGSTVRIMLKVPQFGGATLAIESASGARPLSEDDGFATIEHHDGRMKVLQVQLGAVPAEVQRLRVLVWSPGAQYALAKAQAIGLTDTDDTFDVVLPEAARELRAAELLELYRRGDVWKVRGIAAGWTDVPGMARAIGWPASFFPVAPAPAPVPAAAGSSQASTGSADRARPAPDAGAPAPPRQETVALPEHEGPSPLVGPPSLRDALDMVVGPGARVGDDSFVDFALHGVFMRLTYETRPGSDYVRVVATTPAGEGAITDAVALAALRATHEAPLARISFDDDGAAFVSAPAVAERDHVGTALVKALLAEVWVTANRFAARVRTARWRFPEAPTDELPRELRLGVGEELQDLAAWEPVRDRLVSSDCIPLVDAPAVMLVPTNHGQLAVGPSLLSGTPRGWTILVERTVRANVHPSPGLWTTLARYNDAETFVRFGVQAEGLPGDPPAITVGFSALQLPRTQVFEDLGRGLEMVDEAANAIESILHSLAADSADYRNNLPWTATRRWTGPGSELDSQLLVREVAGLPAAASVPPQLVKRATAQGETLGRAGFGYLAHLALLRAEAKDAESPDWQSVARELVALAPVQPTDHDDPCATASIHVRMARLDAPRPIRHEPPPSPPAGSPPPARRRGLFG